MLGRDFPDTPSRRFKAFLWGKHDRVILNEAYPDSAFGTSLLEITQLDAPILQNFTIVDAPGFLGHVNDDYVSTLQWFAERAALILLMFEPCRLDVSSEHIKSVLQLLVPYKGKLRIVINKADYVSMQLLMRVYGALMWSLARVFDGGECRVYMGSFWDVPLQSREQGPPVEFLRREEIGLLKEIMGLFNKTAISQTMG